MLHRGWIILQCLQCIEFPGQVHFFVQNMNSPVTQLTYVDAPTQIFPGKVFFEIRSPVNFPGNQVMKGQGGIPHAQAAFPILNLVSTHSFTTHFLLPADSCRGHLIRSKIYAGCSQGLAEDRSIDSLHAQRKAPLHCIYSICVPSPCIGLSSGPALLSPQSIALRSLPSLYVALNCSLPSRL